MPSPQIFHRKVGHIGNVLVEKYELNSLFLLLNIYEIEKGFLVFPSLTKLTLLDLVVVSH